MLIPTKYNTRSVTDLRENAIGVLRDANDQGYVYVTHHSKPQAVLMDIDAFSSIQERLEDLQDEVDAAILAQTPVGKLYTLEEVMKEYE